MQALQLRVSVDEGQDELLVHRLHARLPSCVRKRRFAAMR
jgi:hypothetical protein